MSSSSNREPNHLVSSVSPYLQQHAYNPVDWHPWGNKAFELALSQNKPVLVSIGYSACHWCHVMERESFEDDTVAAYMNKHFVCIKVDREEHPHVDHLYMGACQILTGAGGWPLNMFLTPDLKPFTGGTYYPPKPQYGKPSWWDVLMFVNDVWENRREEVLEQANNLSKHAASNERKLISLPAEVTGDKESLDFKKISISLLSGIDKVNGGFGGAPKFPSAMSLTFMMRLGVLNKSQELDDVVRLSLDKMMRGGIYDHVGGGFSRYTVDASWHIPHFEKMLYDNALLMGLYAEAGLRWNRSDYLHIAKSTAAFVEREMLNDEGLFYSAYDADSEGVEGKFYTWSSTEIAEILKSDAVQFAKWFDVKEEGNWEGTNILHLNHGEGQDLDIEQPKVRQLLEQLFEVRKKRVHPLLDDKVNIAWNGWMITAFCKLYRASGDQQYLHTAKRALKYILQHCRQPKGGLFHIWSSGKVSIAGTLDDYSAIINAALNVFQMNGEVSLLDEAEVLYNYAIEHLLDRDTQMFFQAGIDEAGLPERTMDIFDNATPSGNAMMAVNLQLLHVLTGKPEYNVKYDQMIDSMIKSIHKFPSSFGQWLTAALPKENRLAEVVVSGKNAIDTLKDVMKAYYPLSVFLPVCDKKLEKLPIAADRYSENVTRIFLCKGQVCELPVSTVSEYNELLKAF